jgi:hypothetical protein
VTARYVFDLAFEDVIYVAVIAHPSLLKIPDDLEVRLRLSSSAILSKLIVSDCPEIPHYSKSSSSDQFMHHG